ncbi:MAG: hypothetical protein M3N42_11700 [Cyanobacteriota bacterium]|nr:hypothetical protein [Cyanobacteriota bacterium]
MTLQAVLASSIAINILIASFLQKAKANHFLQNRDRNWQRQPDRPDGKKK